MRARVHLKSIVFFCNDFMIYPMFSVWFSVAIETASWPNSCLIQQQMIASIMLWLETAQVTVKLILRTMAGNNSGCVDRYHKILFFGSAAKSLQSQTGILTSIDDDARWRCRRKKNTNKEREWKKKKIGRRWTCCVRIQLPSKNVSEFFVNIFVLLLRLLSLLPLLIPFHYSFCLPDRTQSSGWHILCCIFPLHFRYRIKQIQHTFRGFDRVALFSASITRTMEILIKIVDSVDETSFANSFRLSRRDAHNQTGIRKKT